MVTNDIQSRLLTLDDLPMLKNIYISQTAHMGVEDEGYCQAHYDESLISEYLMPENTEKVMYGTFIQGELVLCMGIFFWLKMPFCTFLRFASLRGYFEGKGIRDPFRCLYDACLAEIERRNCYRFYILSSAQHHEMLAYIGGTWDRLRTHYLMTVEEVVPSHMRPQYDYVWQMMGEKTWPVPLIVRAGTLLNKYRHFEGNIVSSRALDIWDQTGREKP